MITKVNVFQLSYAIGMTCNVMKIEVNNLYAQFK